MSDEESQVSRKRVHESDSSSDDQIEESQGEENTSVERPSEENVSDVNTSDGERSDEESNERSNSESSVHNSSSEVEEYYIEINGRVRRSSARRFLSRRGRCRLRKRARTSSPPNSSSDSSPADGFSDDAD